MSHVAAWGNNHNGQLGTGFLGALEPHPISAAALGNRVAEVAAGGSYTLARLSDGDIDGVGGSTLGQLGTGVRDTQVLNPTKALLPAAKRVSSGSGHSIALLPNGVPCTWGGNMTGAIGNGVSGAGKESAVAYEATPYSVALPLPAIDVVAGGGEAVALLADGTGYAWGENKKGQLGDGTLIERTRPVQIKGLLGCTQLSVGGDTTLPTHMLALLANGTVAAWGAGAGGQLGQGKLPEGSHKLPDSPIPIPVPGLRDVIAVFAGDVASYALLSDGTLMGCGTNHHYQLGNVAPLDALVPTFVPILNGVSNFVAGYQYCLALTPEGLLAWGKNNEGTCGDGTLVDKEVPVLLAQLGDVQGIDAGETHAVALLRGPLAPPKASVVGIVGGLTATWEAPPGTGPFRVGIRKQQPAFRNVEVEPFTHTPLAATSRSYVWTGLSNAQPYEVSISAAGWGEVKLEGTPL